MKRREKNKVIILVAFLFLMITIFQLFNHLKYGANSHFIISSYPKDYSDSLLIINNQTVGTFDLSKIYSLNQSYSLNFGKNIIEVKTVDNNLYYKDSIYFYGIYKFVLIDYIGDDNFYLKQSIFKIGVD